MERIKIDLTPSCMKPVLRASQYDNGREWPCEVLKDGTPYKFVEGDVCEIHVRKGDGCGVTASVPVTVGQSSITITSTEQMCAVYGDNIGELVVTNGTKKIGSCNLILFVESDPMNGSKSSNSEIHDLQNQVNDCVDEALSHKGASDIAFDNTDTGLEANNVQSAIEEVNTKTDDKTDKTYVDEQLNLKMNKANPTGTGSFSMNRKEGTTVGSASVTLGILNTASGAYSSAIGVRNTASGKWAHAIGNDNTASVDSSLALGSHTTARGVYSQSQGNYTLANHRSQFVFGEYNEADDSSNTPNLRGNYVEIVGNGIDANNRSNARTLDWQGNETLAGDLTYNGNKLLTSEISRLDGKIDNLPAPMIFKGTLGVGGTIQSLPTASASNEGYTYKVITDGTYAGQTAKVGDVFTSNGSEWVLIPAGDEDNDTWRAIKINGVEKLGNGISSGAVDFEDTTNVKFEFDANGNKVRATLDGIYTKSEVDNLLDDKADKSDTYTKEQVDDIVYNILPDDTASGSVANFETDLALPIKSLEVDVNAVQEAGTPTPATPLPISGWSSITLEQADGDMQTVNTIVIALGDTYYGGHFTQDKDGHRQLVVDYVKRVLTDKTKWKSRTSSTYNYVYDDTITADRLTGDSTSYLMCNIFQVLTSSQSVDYCRWSGANTSLFAVQLNTISLQDLQDFTENYGVEISYKIATPYTVALPDGEPIATLIGTNNIFADTGDCAVEFKCSVAEYVANHSGGSGAKSLGGVFLGGSNSGSEEEPTEESEDTEKTKEIDDPKEEIKTIGDVKK